MTYQITFKNRHEGKRSGAYANPLGGGQTEETASGNEGGNRCH
jgi:hypothetical protein